MLWGVALAWPLAAQAAVLTFVFGGHATYVNKSDPSGVLTFGAVGDRVVYTFSFNSAAPDQDPQPGRAAYSGLGSGLLVEQQGLECEFPSIRILHPDDLFDVSAELKPNVSGIGSSGFVLFRLSDQDESNALTSVELPSVPYGLDPFANRGFYLNFHIPASSDGLSAALEMTGVIDEFYAIPEPATLLSLLTAAALAVRKFGYAPELWWTRRKGTFYFSASEAQ